MRFVLLDQSFTLPSNRASLKKCECGCGGRAPISTVTNTKWGHVKGQPSRFIHGHHLRKPAPKIDKLTFYWLAGIMEGEGSFIPLGKMRKPNHGEHLKQV